MPGLIIEGGNRPLGAEEMEAGEQSDGPANESGSHDLVAVHSIVNGRRAATQEEGNASEAFVPDTEPVTPNLRSSSRGPPARVWEKTRGQKKGPALEPAPGFSIGLRSGQK